MHTARRSRFRHGVVALIWGAGLLVASGVAVPAGAATGPGNGKIPPEVVAQVPILQQLRGSFTIDPASGPIGTLITFEGTCGFPASNVSFSLTRLTEPGSYSVALVDFGVAIPKSLWGTFSHGLTVDPVDWQGGAIVPGTYYAFATCNALSPTERVLGPRPFTVIDPDAGPS